MPKKLTFPKKIIAVNLFCGAGGLTRGLEKSGIAVHLDIDIDPACEYPYSTNNDARLETGWYLARSPPGIGIQLPSKKERKTDPSVYDLSQRKHGVARFRQISSQIVPTLQCGTELSE